MSRALQINSSPQGWMARNTKLVPLAEKGWVITMKKISIILLSAVLVFSMAACNGGKGISFIRKNGHILRGGEHICRQRV